MVGGAGYILGSGGVVMVGDRWWWVVAWFIIHRSVLRNITIDLLYF